jgi:hypothetical protein
MISETCHICFLSPTYEGKMHDKTIAELEGYRLPPGSCLYQDMGFQGFFLVGMTLIQPKKKPRGGNSPHPRKPPIVVFRRSESALSTPYVVAHSFMDIAVSSVWP